MTSESYLIVTRQDGVSVVAFKEPTLLDAYHVNATAAELYKLIEQAPAGEAPLMVMDLGSIVMLSSQTLSVFLSMREKITQSQGKMVISGIDPNLYRVFKIANLHNLFEFFKDTASAVKSLASFSGPDSAD